MAATINELEEILNKHHFQKQQPAKKGVQQFLRLINLGYETKVIPTRKKNGNT
jgi:hypothetical protein